MGEPVDGNASGESKQSTTTTATTTTTTMANGSGQAGAENGNDTMGVDSSTTTTSSSAGGVSSRQARVNNLKLVEIQQIWEWEPYLQACNGQPAPVEAFCQNFDRIPVNEFKVKDKLEVLSPDLCMKEAVHLGTVVQCIGPRIRIRLDGCDKANDFYRMVDANDIHPVGWAQKSRMFYQPPMRFQKDIAGYLDYVERAITRSSDLAGKQCFKTPPIAPKKNLFKAGMKLEVVDRKVPQDIMPATVTMVNAGKLNIHLDGYEENNDFLIEWNSRDLFPVGWCKKAGLLLKPPGPKAMEEINRVFAPTSPLRTSRLFGNLHSPNRRNISPAPAESTPTNTTNLRSSSNTSSDTLAESTNTATTNGTSTNANDSSVASLTDPPRGKSISHSADSSKQASSSNGTNIKTEAVPTSNWHSKKRAYENHEEEEEEKKNITQQQQQQSNGDRSVTNGHDKNKMKRVSFDCDNQPKNRDVNGAQTAQSNEVIIEDKSATKIKTSAAASSKPIVLPAPSTSTMATSPVIISLVPRETSISMMETSQKIPPTMSDPMLTKASNDMFSNPMTIIPPSQLLLSTSTAPYPIIMQSQASSQAPSMSQYSMLMSRTAPPPTTYSMIMQGQGMSSSQLIMPPTSIMMQPPPMSNAMTPPAATGPSVTNVQGVEPSHFVSSIPPLHVVREWSVAQVCDFLKLKFPTIPADKFKPFEVHEIDGYAFTLLKQENLHQVLELPMGIALRIESAINKIQNLV